MKNLILLLAVISVTLSAETVALETVASEEAMIETTSTPETEVNEAKVEEAAPAATEEKAEETLAKEESKKEEAPKEKKADKKRDISPLLSVGLQFYSSQYNTTAMALNIEGGVNINKKNRHTVEGYFTLTEWNTSNYAIEEVWGINYNYLRLINLGKLIRIDVGVKAGFNYYGETIRNSEMIVELGDDLLKTITFGGPRAQLNLNLKRFGVGAGYTMLAGYREINDEKTSTRIDQFNVTVSLKRKR
jgi:hypothetical protein